MVTSYEQFRIDFDEINQLEWSGIVFDEVFLQYLIIILTFYSLGTQDSKPKLKAYTNLQKN